jgi:hypothetical protein
MSFERCFRRESGSIDFESKSVPRAINRRVVLLAKNRFFDPRQCDKTLATRLLSPSRIVAFTAGWLVGRSSRLREALRIDQGFRLE